MFEKLSLKHMDLYKRYTAGKYICAESSFSNMYIWRKAISTEIDIINDMLVLKVCLKGVCKFVMPFGDNKNAIGCIDTLLKMCNQRGTTLEIIGADKEFVEIIKSHGYNCEFEQDRNACDYVYLSEQLATLQGKKLHSKKNHVNRFKTENQYTFKMLQPHMLEECYENTKIWMYKKYEGDTSKFNIELETVKELIDNYELFDLMGGAIYNESELIAYTIGEGLTNDMALIHVEKANTDYSGAFAAINYEFANYLREKFKYINREEDMGIEGLRKAKESYRPEFLVDKIKCKFQ